MPDVLIWIHEAIVLMGALQQCCCFSKYICFSQSIKLVSFYGFASTDTKLCSLHLQTVLHQSSSHFFLRIVLVPRCIRVFDTSVTDAAVSTEINLKCLLSPFYQIRACLSIELSYVSKIKCNLGDVRL